MQNFYLHKMFLYHLLPGKPDQRTQAHLNRLCHQFEPYISNRQSHLRDQNNLQGRNSFDNRELHFLLPQFPL